jgi:hypothetical protein
MVGSPQHPGEISEGGSATGAGSQRLEVVQQLWLVDPVNPTIWGTLPLCSPYSGGQPTWPPAAHFYAQKAKITTTSPKWALSSRS